MKKFHIEFDAEVEDDFQCTYPSARYRMARYASGGACDLCIPADAVITDITPKEYPTEPGFYRVEGMDGYSHLPQYMLDPSGVWYFSTLEAWERVAEDNKPVYTNLEKIA
jgi:hypothetical protein